MFTRKSKKQMGPDIDSEVLLGLSIPVFIMMEEGLVLTSFSAPNAALQYARMIQKLGNDVKFKDFKVQNIVGSCDVKFPIRLEGLQLQHNLFSNVSLLLSCMGPNTFFSRNSACLFQ